MKLTSVRPVLTAAAMLGAFVFAVTPGFAAPTVSNPVVTSNPSITLVDGWWEREHQEQRARQGYWAMPYSQLQRYNRLQYEINQLVQQRRQIDARISRAEQEQHRMLGFQAQ